MPLIYNNKYVDHVEYDGVILKEVNIGNANVHKEHKITINFRSEVANKSVPFAVAETLYNDNGNVNYSFTDANYVNTVTKEFYIKDGSYLKIDFTTFFKNNSNPGVLFQNTTSGNNAYSDRAINEFAIRTSQAVTKDMVFNVLYDEFHYTRPIAFDEQQILLESSSTHVDFVAEKGTMTYE